jgi:hypothetical protein
VARSETLEQFAEKTLGGAFVAAGLAPDIQHRIVLVHGPPQVIPVTADVEIDFIQMPFVAPSAYALA